MYGTTWLEGFFFIHPQESELEISRLSLTLKKILLRAKNKPFLCIFLFKKDCYQFPMSPLSLEP